MIVYVLPVPVPARSARSVTLDRPVIWKSGKLLPFPLEDDSLLVTRDTRQVGLGSQASVAEIETLTATNLSFGGHSTFGFADTEEITGGLVSRPPSQDVPRSQASPTPLWSLSS